MSAADRPLQGAEQKPSEELQRDIEQTRQQLGDTVEALAQKTDVRAQAKRKVAETKASVAGKKEELLGKATEGSPEAALSAASTVSVKARENSLPVAVGGAFVLGFLAGRLTKD